jgi:deoxyribose-phosphate aldolase
VYHRVVPRTVRISIGADHNGFALKQHLLARLAAAGHAVDDRGTASADPVDYPPIVHAVAAAVASGTADFGIVIDGVGIGSAMVANKVPGVRAAACYGEALARSAREHNDANVLALGSSYVTAEQAERIADAFLAGECTVERYLARVRMIGDLEAGGSTVPGDRLSADDVRRITERVREMLAAPGAAQERQPGPTPEEVARLIDHTLLRPEATRGDIERLCEEARRFSFFSVCVNPAYVKYARALLAGSPVKVCCVVGFPLGAQATEIKVLEARKALREGAAEIDMVVNIGALKSHDDEQVWKDVRAVVEVCKESRALSKVILETALLTDEEKVRGCRLAMRAGADFVKTSTGFSSGGATAEDIALMSRTVAEKKLGVKASGGVRTLADVVRMVQAGATRVGTSSSVKIMEEARAQASGRG